MRRGDLHHRSPIISCFIVFRCCVMGSDTPGTDRNGPLPISSSCFVCPCVCQTWTSSHGRLNITTINIGWSRGASLLCPSSTHRMQCRILNSVMKSRPHTCLAYLPYYRFSTPWFQVGQEKGLFNSISHEKNLSPAVDIRPPGLALAPRSAGPWSSSFNPKDAKTPFRATLPPLLAS